uniref:Uncharacterized protein n=1 Tax=Nelumbo nucifera TaxID=4432 RepID=A0A822XNX1_NELNU|nr:TPA_asm: hypothetical protein HUJ06_022856 [Nelumbo nucifera]
MNFHPYLHAGLIQKLIVLALLSLLVAGEKNRTTSILAEKQPLGSQQRQQHIHRLQLVQLHHPFDMFFSNKRRVPNTSDPLHNR